MWNSSVIQTIFFVFLINGVIVRGEDAMRKMLDAMQRLMTGEDFDDGFYNHIRKCMDTIDPVGVLSESQDAGWQGMIDYWRSNGTEKDWWGSYQTKYLENNASEVSDLEGMVIYEPCNYASNIAYYHVISEICRHNTDTHYPFELDEDYIKGLVQGFSVLALGSSFMHGSHTELGHRQDASTIQMVAYLMHQGSLSSLNYSSILHDLSNTSRSEDSIEAMNDLTGMYINLPIDQWHDYIGSLDVPGYYRIFSAIATTALNMVVEADILDTLLPDLLEIFGVSADDQSFILNQYLPELQQATKNLTIDPIQEVKFIGNCVGTLLRLFYSLLWQEEVFPYDILLRPFINSLGWDYLPTLNIRTAQMMQFPVYEFDFLVGENVYPGDSNCNPKWPHAKWHLESAIGMLNLAYLADDMHRIFSKHN